MSGRLRTLAESPGFFLKTWWKSSGCSFKPRGPAGSQSRWELIRPFIGKRMIGATVTHEGMLITPEGEV